MAELNHVIVYVIFVIMIVEGIIQMATGKAFFYGTDKYDPESLKMFSKKSGIGSVLMGIGAIAFSYGLEAQPHIIKWAAIGGLVFAIAGFINFSICHKKYLRKY